MEYEVTYLTYFTLFLRLGCRSRESGGAILCILTGHSWAKIPGLGETNGQTEQAQIRPSDHDIVAISGLCLDIAIVRIVDTKSDWLIAKQNISRAYFSSSMLVTVVSCISLYVANLATALSKTWRQDSIRKTGSLSDRFNEGIEEKKNFRFENRSLIEGQGLILGNPVPLPDPHIDSFSYPVASIVFGDMAIVSLFLLLFFLANPRSCLYRLAHYFKIL